VKNMPQKNYPLQMSFYEHPAQKQLCWYTHPAYKNDTTALRTGDLMFFTETLSSETKAPPGFSLKREYDYYPPWILSNNTNNWQSRSRVWTVYSLQ